MVNMELFSVQLQKDGESHEIMSTEFRRENGSGQDSVFVYTNGDDRIVVKINHRKLDGEEIGSVELDAQGSSTLVSLRYPWVIC